MEVYEALELLGCSQRATWEEVHEAYQFKVAKLKTFDPDQELSTGLTAGETMVHLEGALLRLTEFYGAFPCSLATERPATLEPPASNRLRRLTGLLMGKAASSESWVELILWFGVGFVLPVAAAIVGIRSLL